MVVHQSKSSHWLRQSVWVLVLTPARCAVAAFLIGLYSGQGVAQPANLAPSSAALLPTLGDNSDLSAAAERRIGQRIAASIYRDPDYVDDAVLDDYVQSIWQPLMTAASARGELSAELGEHFAWRVFLMRDRTVNAFALPGGYFGVHLGLIATVSSRHELAAVLSHEMSHVTQRHISRLLTQQTRQAPWVIGALILGALAASKNPQAASAAIVGGQAAAAQSQLNFSRDMEREADRVGFGLMLDAGFDVRGAASMFEKLQQASRFNDNGAFAYLRSHPLSGQRIGEAQARAQLILPSAFDHPSHRTSNTSSAGTGTGTGTDNPAQGLFLHAMMAARARVLADSGVDALRLLLTGAQSFASAPQTAAPPADARSAVANARSAGTLYAGALAAAKLREPVLAQRLVAALTQLATSTAAQASVGQTVELLTLEVELLAGRVPTAAAKIDLTQVRQRADVLTKAQALLAAGRHRAVADRLATWVTMHPSDAAAWQLLVLAYANQNQNVRAVRADAEARVAQLDYAGALERLRAAQTLMLGQPTGSDFIESSVVEARLRQVTLLVKEQALQDKVDR